MTHVFPMKTLAFRFLLYCICLSLTACSLPAKIALPSGTALREGHMRMQLLDEMPPPQVLVLPGDTLRIVRDAQSPAQKDEMTLYVVRPDGNISVPFIGTITVAERTPEEIAEEITEKYRPIYLQPGVTVNIAEAPSNRIFVGGEVRNPSVYPLNGAGSIEQVIIAAGGVLPSADSENIALLRQTRDGKYDIYFFDYAKLLFPSENRRPALLQRGDIVFVPKSGVANMAEAIDMYVNRLFPINKGIALGFAYDLRQSGDTKVRINAP